MAGARFLTRTWRNMFASGFGTTCRCTDAKRTTVEFRITDAPEAEESTLTVVICAEGHVSVAQPGAAPDATLTLPAAAAYDLLVANDVEAAAASAERGELTFDGSLGAVTVFQQTCELNERQRACAEIASFTVPPDRWRARADTPHERDNHGAEPAPLDVESLAREFRALRALLPDLESEPDRFGWQLSIVRGDQTSLSCFGTTRRAGPFSERTLVPWLCCTKLLGVLLTLRLIARSQLDLATPIASVLPAFGHGGKEAIRVEHLLRHETGVYPDPLERTTLLDRAELTRLACSATAGVRPGSTVAYSSVFSWIALAATLETLTGRTYTALVADEVLLPAGVRDEVVFGNITDDEFDRIAIVFEPRSGNHALPYMNTVKRIQCALPHSGAASPIHLLARLAYESLLSPSDKVLTARSQAAVRKTSRGLELDGAYKTPVSWGLGLMWAPEIFGPDGFGHLGLGTTCFVVFPRYDAVMSFFSNRWLVGRDHYARVAALTRALASDLAELHGGHA